MLKIIFKLKKNNLKVILISLLSSIPNVKLIINKENKISLEKIGQQINKDLMEKMK